ncbi:MAG: hypothetical protein ACXWW0_04145 [Bacteroidia bacterium]
MNTMQPLNKILFLLDEISECKQRLNMATAVTRDIEVAILQSKTIELYSEIQQYNKHALHASAPQVQANTYQPAAIQTPVKETHTAPEPETVAAPKPEPIAERSWPENRKSVTETSETEEKQPKPIHPQSGAPLQETTQVKEEQAQPQTPRREISDFERKREKLLREEKVETKSPEPVINQQPVNTEPEIKKWPEPAKPVAPKPETVQQPVSQVQPEVTKPESQHVQAAPSSEKPNVSQLYDQAHERSAANPVAEKSLNEKLAPQQQQTSLNDKFQTHVKKNLADKLKLSPISDLRSAININQRVAFINQLFKGDDKEFKNVVSTVNGFRNFSEAKFFVQSEVAPRFSWNEEDAVVQDFMELVYRKFL